MGAEQSSGDITAAATNEAEYSKTPLHRTRTQREATLETGHGKQRYRNSCSTSRFALSRVLERNPKRILVLGLPNAGKNAVISLLMKSAFRGSGPRRGKMHPVGSHRNSSSQTGSFTTYFDIERNETLTKATGVASLGDCTSRNLKRMLTQAAHFCRKGFHTVILVIKGAGLPSPQVQQNLLFLETLLGDGWQRSAVLVFTHETQRMAETWRDTYRSQPISGTKSLLAIRRVYFIETATASPQTKQEYATRLREAVDDCTELINSDCTLREWLLGIGVSVFRGDPTLSLEKLIEIVDKMLSRGRWKYRFGPCLVCRQEICAVHYEGVALAPCCSQVFHTKCLPDNTPRCPNCGANFSQLFNQRFGPSKTYHYSRRNPYTNSKTHHVGCRSHRSACPKSDLVPAYTQRFLYRRESALPALPVLQEEVELSKTSGSQGLYFTPTENQKKVNTTINQSGLEIQINGANTYHRCLEFLDDFRRILEAGPPVAPTVPTQSSHQRKAAPKRSEGHGHFLPQSGVAEVSIPRKPRSSGILFALRHARSLPDETVLGSSFNESGGAAHNSFRGSPQLTCGHSKSMVQCFGCDSKDGFLRNHNFGDEDSSKDFSYKYLLSPSHMRHDARLPGSSPLQRSIIAPQSQALHPPDSPGGCRTVSPSTFSSPFGTRAIHRQATQLWGTDLGREAA